MVPPTAPPEGLCSFPKYSFGKRKNNFPWDTQLQCLFKTQSHYLEPLIITCLKSCSGIKFIFQNKCDLAHMYVLSGNICQNMNAAGTNEGDLCDLLFRMPSPRIPFKPLLHPSLLSELPRTRLPYNHNHLFHYLLHSFHDCSFTY